MVSSDARMVRLEPKESLARYSSTGFSSRGRSAARIAGGGSTAGGDDTPSPEEKSWPIRAAIVASGSRSATLRPPDSFGSENSGSHNSGSHNLNIAPNRPLGQGLPGTLAVARVALTQRLGSRPETPAATSSVQDPLRWVRYRQTSWRSAKAG